MDKRIIILRGAPGSGKSTLAGMIQYATNGHIFETDKFFMGTDGKYRWIPKLVPAAHEWCRRAVEKAMEAGLSPIIISNTNTEKWQYEPYLYLAALHGYKHQFIALFAPKEQQNVHSVPEAQVEKMEEKLRVSICAGD